MKRINSYIKKLLLFTLTTSSGLQAAVESDAILGSLFGACIGDALGAPTEAINIRLQNKYGKPTDKSPGYVPHALPEIFKIYPKGIHSFKDLENYDSDHFLLLTGKTDYGKKVKFAPYTDDSAMARITMQVLLQSRNGNWDLEKTMTELAMAYVYDKEYNNDGWAKLERAPGNSCKISADKLKDYLFKHLQNHKDFSDLPKEWWKQGIDSKGCGSVMRAHAFGLVWADDLNKAFQWAAEHSAITHNHAEANASCAAMAAGIALIATKSTHNALNCMQKIAESYDKSTSEKITKAIQAARENSKAENLFDASKPFFEQYLGWTAGDAITAATYIVAIVPDNIEKAWNLGVHGPGDTDSIASMGAALVGANVGFGAIKEKEPDYQKYEGSRTIQKMGNDAFNLIRYRELIRDITTQELYSQKLLAKMKTNNVSHEASSSKTSSGWKWGLAIAAVAAILYWWNS